MARVGVLLLVLFAWTGAAEAAPRRANLVVSSLSEKPQLTFQATVKNTGKAKAKKSRLALLLSKDAKRSKDDLKLVVVNVKALARRKSARVTLRTALPAAAAPGMRFLACADDAGKLKESKETDNCRAGRVLPAVTTPPLPVVPLPTATPGPAPEPTATPAPTPAPGPPNLTVTPQRDTDNAVTQDIGVLGGTVEATGADGTQYTLDIPEDALLSQAEITMTPLKGVGGAAMSGPVYGVDLEPHGLRLTNPGKLTITPATPLPLSDQMGFGYNGAGELFHYAPLMQDNTEIALQISHFSGHGAGGTTPADREKQAAAAYPPSAGEEAAMNTLGAIAKEWKDTGQFPKEKFEAAFRSWYENSVKPSLLAAQTQEAKVYPALKEWLSWGKTMALIGFADTLNPNLEQPLGREASAAYGSARKVIINAYKRARDACLVDHDVQAAPRMLQYDKDGYLLFNEHPATDWKADLQACLHFELDFSVSFTEYTEYDTDHVEVSVGDVPIVLNDALYFVTVEKPLTFDSWTKSTASTDEDGNPCTYSLTEITDKVPFAFWDLEMDLNYSDESPTAAADRVKLHFRPGQGHAVFDSSCAETETPDDVLMNLWPGTWLSYHPEIGSTFQGRVLGGFSYVGSSVLARRVYDIDIAPTEELGGYAETTTIEIRHTPG
jgi:hypothetical protein